jgi:hypothetical protein
LVEVVRFFVTYGLARNKTGSVNDGITELYQKKKNITHKMENKTTKLKNTKIDYKKTPENNFF